MASLYKPQIVEYRLRDGSYRTPDGERVTSKTRGAVKTKRKSAFWYGRYTDGNGERHQVKLSESKEIARRMLAKLAGDAQLAGVGLADPFADHRYRPLVCPACQSSGVKEDGAKCDCPGGAHLSDFGRFLRAKGNTDHYCGKTVARARAVIEGCKFEKADDLQASRVVEFLAGLREDRPAPELGSGKTWYTIPEAAALLNITPESLRHQLRLGPIPGPKPDKAAGRPQRLHRDTVAGLLERRTRGLGVSTSNDYLGAVKRFSKWLVRDRRALVDPLAHLERVNPRVDVRHARRHLPAADFARFIEATAAGKPFRGLSGADRLAVYLLSANTGLRESELASLTPASFDFDAATVTVKAGYSKHRREDVQPLRRDVADMMRAYTAGRPRDERLWPGRWSKDGAAMVRRDLDAAGIAYWDEDGRVFDFHSLRHTFLSHLAESGVHPKVAQVLARHSTITLTMDRYTHLQRLDVAKGLEKLPELPGGETKTAAPRKGRRKVACAG